MKKISQLNKIYFKVRSFYLFCIKLYSVSSKRLSYDFETTNYGSYVSGIIHTDRVGWGRLYSVESLLLSLQWRHNEHDGVSNYQPHECLLNHLFRRRSKKTSKLRVTGLWVGNSPLTGEFPAPRASNAENVSIWWRHHDIRSTWF